MDKQKQPEFQPLLPLMGQDASPAAKAIDLEEERKKNADGLFGAVLRSSTFGGAIAYGLTRTETFQHAIGNNEYTNEVDPNFNSENFADVEGAKYQDDASRMMLLRAVNRTQAVNMLSILDQSSADGATISANGAGGTVAGLGAGAVEGVFTGKVLSMGTKAVLTKAGVTAGVGMRVAGGALGAAGNIAQSVADANLRGLDYNTEQAWLDGGLGALGEVFNKGEVPPVETPSTTDSTGSTALTVYQSPRQRVFVGGVIEDQRVKPTAPTQIGTSFDPNVIDVQAREIKDPVNAVGPANPIWTVEDAPVGETPVAPTSRQVEGPSNTLEGYDYVRNSQGDGTQGNLFGEPSLVTVDDVAIIEAKHVSGELVPQAASPEVIKGKTDVTLKSGLDLAAYKLGTVFADGWKQAKGKFVDQVMPATALFTEKLSPYAQDLVTAIRGAAPGIADSAVYEYARQVYKQVEETKATKGSPVVLDNLHEQHLDTRGVFETAPARDVFKEMNQEVMKDTTTLSTDVTKELPNVTKGNPVVEALEARTVVETTLDKLVGTTDLGDPLRDAHVANIEKSVADSGLSPEAKEHALEAIREFREDQRTSKDLLANDSSIQADPSIEVPSLVRTVQVNLGKKVGKAPHEVFHSIEDRALALAYKPDAGPTNTAFADARAYLKKVYPGRTDAEIQAAAKHYREKILPTEIANIKSSREVNLNPEGIQETLGEAPAQKKQRLLSDNYMGQHYSDDASFQRLPQETPPEFLKGDVDVNKVKFDEVEYHEWLLKMVDNFVKGEDGKSPAALRTEHMQDELAHWESEKALGKKPNYNRINLLKDKLDNESVPEDIEHYAFMSQKGLLEEKARLEKLVADDKRIRQDSIDANKKYEAENPKKKSTSKKGKKLPDEGKAKPELDDLMDDIVDSEDTGENGMDAFLKKGGSSKGWDDLFSRPGVFDTLSNGDKLVRLSGFAKALFGKLADKLIANGKLVIVKSVDDLPGKHPYDVKGMYHKGVAYIVAGNVSGREAFGVLLHEVGVHMGLKGLMGDNWTSLLKQAKDIPEVAQIMEQIKGLVPEKHLVEEAIAYLVQSNPELSFVKRLVSELKVAVYRLLGDGSLAGHQLIKLGADDMTTLAVQALRKESRTFGEAYDGNYLMGTKGWTISDEVPAGHPDEYLYSLNKVYKKATEKTKRKPGIPHLFKTFGRQFETSKNPGFRLIGSLLSEDTDIGKTRQANGASLAKEQESNKLMKPFEAAYGGHFENYMKEIKGSIKDRGHHFREFGRLVSLHVEEIELSDLKSVKAGAAEVQAGIAKSLGLVHEWAETLKAWGFKQAGTRMEDWAQVNGSKRYMPRLDNYEHMHQMNSVMADHEKGVSGRDSTRNFIYEGLKAGNPNAIDAHLRTMAEMRMRWMEYSSTSPAGQHIHLLPSREAMENMVRGVDDVMKNMPQEQMDALVNDLMESYQVAEPGDTRTRGRMKMDTSVYREVNGQKIYLAELFETDAKNRTTRYMNQVAGTVGLARTSVSKSLGTAKDLEGVKLPDYVIEKDGQVYVDMTHKKFFDDFKQMIAMSPEKDELHIHEATMESLDGTWRYVNGMPLNMENTGDGTKILKIMSNLTTFRGAWLFTLAMASEFGKTAMSSRLFGSAMQNMPKLARDIFAMRRGSDAFKAAEEWAKWTGIGMDRWVNPAYAEGDGMVNSLLARSKNLSNFTLRYSGFYAVNDSLKLWNLRAEALSMMDYAKTGSIPDAHAERLNAYGIPKKDQMRVAKLLERFYDKSRGEPNFAEMHKADPEGMTILQGYMARMGKKSSSEATHSQTMPWTHGAVAQNILQFQKSAIDSTLVHLIHDPKFKDAELVTGWVGAYAAAIGSYVAVTYLRHYGDSEELKKRLADKEIMKNAFARAAFSGVTTKLLDVMALAYSGQPMFSGRNQGDVFMPTPASWQTLSGAASVATSPISIAAGSKTSKAFQNDVTMAGGAMLLLAPGIKAAINANLPKSLPKD